MSDQKINVGWSLPVAVWRQLIGLGASACTYVLVWVFNQFNLVVSDARMDQIEQAWLPLLIAVIAVSFGVDLDALRSHKDTVRELASPGDVDKKNWWQVGGW